jgi:glycosyltransferase involved in cell wall biosynthesis
MKILFITHHYLYGNGGGVFASRAYINAFAKISNKITVLYPMKKGSYPSEIIDSVDLIPVCYERSKIIKFIDLCRGHLHRYFDVFEEQLKKQNYDIVVFDNSKVSFKLIEIVHRYKAKVIVIHHNYEYEYTRDNSDLLTKYPLLYWTCKCEKEAVNTCDLNLTLTQQDIDLLKKHYIKTDNVLFERIGVFENKRFGDNVNNTNQSINPVFEQYFIITGSLNSKQTEKSLLLWISKYFPILIDVFPDAQLTIAGKSPSKKLKKICSHYRQIQLIDTPPDIQLILKTANYYLCPIFLGGGLKLRIMDGLKNGLPVLSHAVSARGYEDFKRLGCLFDYNNKKSFRIALIELMKSEVSKKQVIELYHDLFSFESGIKRLSKIIRCLNI